MRARVYLALAQDNSIKAACLDEIGRETERDKRLAEWEAMGFTLERTTVADYRSRITGN